MRSTDRDNGEKFSPKDKVLALCGLLERKSQIDNEEVGRLVKTLSDAIAEGHQICFDGEGRSLNVAQAFRSIILGIGGQAYLGKQPPVYRQGARYVVISGSGTTTGPLKRMQLAKKAGLETILITADASSEKNIMSTIADHTLDVVARGEDGGIHKSHEVVMNWLESQLDGISEEAVRSMNEVAPMGTLFEQSAFITSLLACINIADSVRGIETPRLRAIIDSNDYGKQMSKLLELSIKGGTVKGKRIRDLGAEADSAGARGLTQLLFRGGNVLVSGEGVTDSVMEMFAQRLYHLKFMAHTTSGTIVPPITSEMMVVCASRSGYSNSPLVSATIAARKESRLAVITGDPKGSLAQVAEKFKAPAVFLSDLGYATHEGFEEKRFTRKMMDPIDYDIVDPVFATKCLLLCDGVVAKLMELLSITESSMKARHQLDKEKI